VTIPVGQPRIAQGATIYVSFSAEINAHTTESLIAAMANCANARPAQVVLLLSTPGGVVMNGMNLYNVLRAMPFKLVTHNVGNVDSIGKAVFLAGEELPSSRRHVPRTRHSRQRWDCSPDRGRQDPPGQSHNFPWYSSARAAELLFLPAGQGHYALAGRDH
jgi:hypothetical protein